MTNRQADLPCIHCQYLGEPKLEFADSRLHVDPKLGISRFGPKSFSPRRHHPDVIHLGFIGTAESMATAREWVRKCSAGVAGDDKHPEFPGFMSDRGFFSELQFDDDWNAQLCQAEVEGVLETRPSRMRFDALLGLLERKLGLLSTKDQPPTCIVLALPDVLYAKCRVTNYRDPHLGDVHRDLRRAFKALAMKYRIPTQLVRQQTVDGRERDHPSKVAWNFFTGLYFKAGGAPWGPTGLTPGTCYLGIAFYRSLGSTNPLVHTSLVQAFDEHGNGLVLRGPDFNWNSREKGTRSPHLNAERAERILTIALDRYRDEMQQTPQRVVVHKSSVYWPEERIGFKAVLGRRVSRFDLLSLDTRQSFVRLLTTASYPPLRGTRFTIGDKDYLYTTGFIADLGQFHSLHVPSPIRVADHIGQDTSRETLLREVLVLTKMNWNSSRLGGKSPITLRFSDLVGEIMQEIPPERDPLPQFKFYM
ncbi:MAG: hypothetical protein FJ291_17450 [Planctomycetes bacterium]|nr:hypothetical protein [Planctomycetota bacterium]